MANVFASRNENRKRNFGIKLIQLTSPSDNKCTKVEFNGVEISDTCEIAEAFNTNFIEIGKDLANKISITDTDPIS